MDERTKRQKGSPYRDAFKHWHKNAKGQCSKDIGIDIDFMVVEFSGEPNIAVLDVKMPGEKPTDTEVVAYRGLESKDIPVYFVTPIKYTVKKCKECGKLDVEIAPDSEVILTRFRDRKRRKYSSFGYFRWERWIRDRHIRKILEENEILRQRIAELEKSLGKGGEI